jgi:hypothetical protein
MNPQSIESIGKLFLESIAEIYTGQLTVKDLMENINEILDQQEKRRSPRRIASPRRRLVSPRRSPTKRSPRRY